MSVTTSERHVFTGAKQTCPKCQGKRLVIALEWVRDRETPSYDPSGHRYCRVRFQCLGCWHVWYEEE